VFAEKLSNGGCKSFIHLPLAKESLRLNQILVDEGFRIKRRSKSDEILAEMQMDLDEHRKL